VRWLLALDRASCCQFLTSLSCSSGWLCGRCGERCCWPRWGGVKIKCFLASFTLAPVYRRSGSLNSPLLLQSGRRPLSRLITPAVSAFAALRSLLSVVCMLLPSFCLSVHLFVHCAAGLLLF
jgi:hypothetical protein